MPSYIVITLTCHTLPPAQSRLPTHISSSLPHTHASTGPARHHPLTYNTPRSADTTSHTLLMSTSHATDPTTPPHKSPCPNIRDTIKPLAYARYYLVTANHPCTRVARATLSQERRHTTWTSYLSRERASKRGRRGGGAEDGTNAGRCNGLE
jgi:hypothetical protein